MLKLAWYCHNLTIIPVDTYAALIYILLDYARNFV